MVTVVIPSSSVPSAVASAEGVLSHSRSYVGPRRRLQLNSCVAFSSGIGSYEAGASPKSLFGLKGSEASPARPTHGGEHGVVVAVILAPIVPFSLYLATRPPSGDCPPVQ